MEKVYILDEKINEKLKWKYASLAYDLVKLSDVDDLIDIISQKTQTIFIINISFLDDITSELIISNSVNVIVSYDKYSVAGLLKAIRIHSLNVILNNSDINEIIKCIGTTAHSLKDDISIYHISDSVLFSPSQNKIVNQNNIFFLTNKERLLLELLFSCNGKVVSYSDIETVVWMGDYMSPDALRSLVKTIRKKLPDGAIRTIKGYGYMCELHIDELCS